MVVGLFVELAFRVKRDTNTITTRCDSLVRLVFKLVVEIGYRHWQFGTVPSTTRHQDAREIPLRPGAALMKAAE